MRCTNAVSSRFQSNSAGAKWAGKGGLCILSSCCICSNSGRSLKSSVFPPPIGCHIPRIVSGIRSSVKLRSHGEAILVVLHKFLSGQVAMVVLILEVLVVSYPGGPLNWDLQVHQSGAGHYFLEVFFQSLSGLFVILKKNPMWLGRFWHICPGQDRSTCLNFGSFPTGNLGVPRTPSGLRFWGDRWHDLSPNRSVSRALRYAAEPQDHRNTTSSCGMRLLCCSHHSTILFFFTSAMVLKKLCVFSELSAFNVKSCPYVLLRSLNLKKME